MATVGNFSNFGFDLAHEMFNVLPFLRELINCEHTSNIKKCKVDKKILSKMFFPPVKICSLDFDKYVSSKALHACFAEGTNTKAHLKYSIVSIGFYFGVKILFNFCHYQNF